MSLARPSSNDVLLTLFPKIEDSLMGMLLKFTLECDPYLDKKDMKLNLSNDFLNNFLERFPRNFYGYKIAVDRYVSFGQYAPQAAIELLLTFLPKTKNNELFRKFVGKIKGYNLYADIIDDIFLLFFADCTAQLLSAKDDVTCYETLISLALPLLTPLNDPIREHIRNLLLNQFSVIYSFISIKHLELFLNSFTSSLAKDIPSTLILYKFLRLVPSPTVTIAMIEEFLSQLFSVTKNFPKKPTPAEITWAQSLCFLTAQIKTEGLPSMASSLTNIFNFVTNRINGNDQLIYHYRLAAIILMRDTTLLSQKYKDFLAKYIVEKSKKNTECALHAFLMILRGNWFSRTSLFWEWGSFHHDFRQGIEATHLYEPAQEQRNNPDSFTEFFFNTFSKIPGVDQYYTLLSDILINLAARDFIYFCRETIPRFMIALGPKCIYTLSQCLLQISAKEFHFEEWIADMPLNSGHKIEAEVKTLFVTIKSQLFSLVDQQPNIGLTNTAFWFDLKGAFSAPYFELPRTTQPISTNMTFRITEATNSVANFIKNSRYQESAADLTIKFESIQIEHVSSQEDLYIKVLTFYPHIITYGDIQNPAFTDRLKSYLLSKSKAVSLFAIDMLDHLYAANASFRLAILNLILQWLSDTDVAEHTFIILELFVKLFDLSLRPAAPPKPGQDGTATDDCPVNLIQDFTDNAQATLVYLLAMPYPELRDLAVCAIERLSKFANSLKTSSPLEHILSDLDQPISNAVSYKCQTYEQMAFPNDPSLPTNTVSFRTAACARFNNFFSFYIPEIISSFEHKVSLNFVEKLVKTSLKAMSRLDFNGNFARIDTTIWQFYRNLAIIASNIVPTIDHNMYKLLISQYPLEFVSFHNYQVMAGFDNDERRIKLAPFAKLVNEKFSSILKFIATSQNDKIVDILLKCFSLFRWTQAANFAPEFLEFLKTANFSNQNVLIYALRILNYFSQNPDFKFSLSSQPLYSQIITILGTESNKLLNAVKPFNEAKIKTKKDNYVPLVLNYLRAFWFTFTSMTVDIEEKLCGPFRIPKSFAWINDIIGISTDIIHLTLNFAPLKDSTDKEIRALHEMSERLIPAVIAAVPVLNQEVEKMVIVYEKLCLKTQFLGWNTMHLALFRNFKQLIGAYIRHSYDLTPTTARTYFKAIFNAILPDASCFIDRTKTYKKMDDRRTQQILSTMMHTLNNETSQPAAVLVDEEQLNPFERVLNRDILGVSGAIFFISLLYLLDDTFELRSAAFNLINRLIPFVLAVLEAHDPAKAAEALKSLDHFIGVFNSSVTAIPPSTIRKIAAVLSKYLPQVSELIIKEAIDFIKVKETDSYAATFPQSAVLEVINSFLKNIAITSRNVLSEVSSKFAVYTPYSILEELINLYPYIKAQGKSAYLAIWSSCVAGEGSLPVIFTFLFEFAKKEANAQAVQTILLFIAQSQTQEVINALVERISFGYWFYNNMQLHSSDPQPPEFSFQECQVVCSTLVEIAQICPQNLLAGLHSIIHFALIYYDYAPKAFCEILFIIMTGLPKCPSEIAAAFLPPGALTWDLSQPIKGLPEDRNPVAVSEMAAWIVKYFSEQKAKKILQNWGKEAVRWATGCGDLKIASRSAIILSKLLSPVDGRMIVSVIRNAHNLMRVPTSDESGEYLMAIFSLLSAIIDKRVQSSKFAPSFKYIFVAACEFIKLTPVPKLAQAALTIVAKYIMYGQTEYDQMRDLLATFTDLMVTLNERRTVDGAFMACMFMNKPPLNIHGTHINQLAFIAFLPRIYSALASCHNIEPYLTEVSESEVNRVLQCAVSLGAHGEFLPPDLSAYFVSTMKKPNTTTLDEFALKCANDLTRESFQAVVEATPLLLHIAKGREVALREAVFSIVFAFLGIADFISSADAFSQIVALAANSSSEAASNLLQRFMELANDAPFKVDLPVYNFPSRQSGSISTQLEELDKDEIQLPTGQVTLEEDSLLIVPHEQTLWDHEIFRKLKQDLAKIQVMPFTNSLPVLESLKAEIARDESQKIIISPDPQDYIEYKNF